MIEHQAKQEQDKLIYSDQLVLGYWNTMGLAQPLRYILAFSQIKWIDKVYYQKNEWFKQDKINIGLVFSNLPYLIDSQFNLTQSKAILYYLARRLNLKDILGKTIQDSGRIDCIISVCDEINSAYFQSLKQKEWQLNKEQIYNRFKSKIDQLQQIVGEIYCVGYLTIADFRLVDTIYAIVTLFQSQSKSLKKLKSITKNFYSIHSIRKYLETGVKNFFPSFVNCKLILDIKTVDKWNLAQGE